MGKVFDPHSDAFTLDVVIALGFDQHEERHLDDEDVASTPACKTTEMTTLTPKPYP